MSAPMLLECTETMASTHIHFRVMSNFVNFSDIQLPTFQVFQGFKVSNDCGVNLSQNQCIL